MDREKLLYLLYEYNSDEINIKHVIQKPGDIVVVYPKTYHIVIYVTIVLNVFNRH